VGGLCFFFLVLFFFSFLFCGSFLGAVAVGVFLLVFFFVFSVLTEFFVVVFLFGFRFFFCWAVFSWFCGSVFFSRAVSTCLFIIPLLSRSGRFPPPRTTRAPAPKFLANTFYELTREAKHDPLGFFHFFHETNEYDIRVLEMSNLKHFSTP